jgi:hypothetical protein
LVAEAYGSATGDDALIRRVEERKRAVRAAGDPERPLRSRPS